MIVREAIGKGDLLQFYEREQDWLDEVLVQIAADAPVGDTSTTPANVDLNLVKRTLETVYRFHKILKDYATENRAVLAESVVDVLPLFESIGDALQQAVEKGKGPLIGTEIGQRRIGLLRFVIVPHGMALAERAAATILAA